MTHEESIAEAERLLREAGWAPHNTWNCYTRGPLVMGFDPSGNFHVKDTSAIREGHPAYGPDTPDEPHEAAAWLVARFALAPAPEEADDAGHEAHGEAGADSSDGGLDQARSEGGVGSSDADDGSVGLSRNTEGAGEYAGGANGDLPGAYSGSADDDAGSSGGNGGSGLEVSAPLDADFEELATLSYDDTPAEAAPPEQSGGVAIFGDNFATMRLAKMGRLAQIAAEKSAAANAAVGWTDDEYNAVQAHVVSNLAKSTGAYTGGQQAIYDRFMAMEAAKQRVNGFRVHRDQCTDYLNAADTPRVMVEQFDPDAGWPG